MQRRWTFISVLTLLVGAACNPPDESKSSIKIDISTWWTKGGEKDALEKLEEINHELHPNVTLLVNRGADAEEAFATLDSRLYKKNPPDTFQANGGSRLLSRVVRAPKGSASEDDDIPQVARLDTVYARTETKIWPALKDLVQVEGVYYGVPLNVHRINNLYFSIEKLKTLRGLEHIDSYEDLRLPQSLDEFIELAKTLTEKRGGGAVGIGVFDPWTLETLVFENLLPSVALSDSQLGDETAKKQFFELFWMGRKPPTEEANFRVIENSLLKAQELWPNVTTFGQLGLDDGRGDWTSPFDVLCEDSPVSLVVMGDWATGYLNSKGFVEGTDYGVIPFPGTEELFILTTDTLPLTAYAKNREATEDFLVTALTAHAQQGFNAIKGSVPAIVTESLPELEFGTYQRESLERLKDTRIYKTTAMSGLLTPNLPTVTLRDGLDAMLAPPDDTEADVASDVFEAQRRSIVHNILKNDYWLFQEWTNRLEEYQ